MLTAIPKGNSGAPSLNSQILWADPSARIFYAWGGSVSSPLRPPSNQVWKFTADGAGGGAWAQAAPSNARGFGQLVRPEGCAAATAGGVGYCMGGLAGSQTDPSVSSAVGFALPGLVTFGTRSGVWTNASTAGFRDFGTLIYGRAEFVPFGAAGLLVFLGGSQAPVTGYPSASRQLTMDTVDIYDLGARAWLSQATSGDRPSTRERFCTVGAQGPNGTYEIFLYGGISSQTGGSSDEVFVLSLPGFVFFRAPAGTPRGDHACALVGRRQMLSVGGIDGFRGSLASFRDPDPWAQGLGVFDLTRLEWSDGYDADAAPYESPAVVARFYAQGGLASVPWSSDAVRALFAAGMCSPSLSTLPT